MTETHHKHEKRFRVFSLKSLMIVIALIACIFALFAFQLQRFRKNNLAIVTIREAGAPVYVRDSRGRYMNTTEVNSPDLLSVLTSQPTAASLIDMSSPSLATSDIRKLIPDMQRLIPYSNGSSERHISIELSGNPNISADFVEEIRNRLPNCQFVKYTPVPNGAQNAIRIGMSEGQLVETIGTLIYDQRNDWPDEKARTVKMLGSQMNAKYTNSIGNETWTYFTDDVGVGVLGVDFDANQNVVDIWSDRGISVTRELTKNEPMIGGL